MGATDQLKILISVVDRASGALDSIKSNVLGLAAAYVSFQGAQAALHGAISAISSATQAAMEQEAADVKLEGALRRMGQASAGTMKHLTDLAGALQETTLFSDDQIQSAQALLVTLGRLSGDGLDRATKASADLAATLGMDLEQAAEMIAKAANGNTLAFGKMGIKFDEAATNAQKLDGVLRFVEGRMAGAAAEAANTFQGRVHQVSVQFGELQEAFGKTITDSPVVNEALKGIAEILKSLTEEFKKGNLDDSIKAITISLAEMASTVLLVMGSLTAAKTGLGQVTDSVKGFSAEWFRLNEKGKNAATFDSLWEALKKPWTNQASGTTQALMDVREQLNALIERLEATPASTKKAGDSIKNNIVPPANEATESLSALQKMWKELVEGTEDDQIQQALFGNAKQWTDDIDAWFAQFKAAWGEFQTQGAQAWMDFDLPTSKDLWPEGSLDSALEAQAKLDEQVDLTLVGYQELQGAAQSFGSTMVDAAFGAKIAWGKFFKQLLVDIAKAIVQALILRAVAGVFTGGIGALGGGGKVPAGTILDHVNALNTGGMVLRAQGGMQVPGTRVNRDTVPALLTPGEVVLRAPVVEEIERRMLGTQAGAGFTVINNFNNLIDRRTVEEFTRKQNELAEHMGMEVLSTRQVA